MEPPENAWPNSDLARGVLFFAQHMREMLTQTSFESFRASTLDLISRVNELLNTIQTVEDSHLPPSTIDPVLAEVVASLRGDLVARSEVEGEIEILSNVKGGGDLKKSEIVSLTGLCNLLVKRAGNDYANRLEAAILDCYADKSRRNDLRVLSASYCSYLINIGYSKKHLIEIVENRFFTDDIIKIEKRSLQRFFASLIKQDRKFRVWIASPATTANLIGKLDLDGFEVHPLRSLPADARDAFTERADFSTSKRYIARCVEAKDRYAAAAILGQLLSSIDSFVILARDNMDLVWDDVAYVRTPRATQGEFVTADVFSLQGRSRPVRRAAAAVVRSQASRALSEFNTASTERLLSAVNTAALARNSPNLENHLISLWSALEVLLSNPPAGIPRIVHYIDLLAPCICSKYVRRYIVAVYDGIAASYPSIFSNLIRNMQIPSNVDEYTRFTHLMFDPAFKDDQEDLLQILTRNPLALHRLWKLHRDFGTPKEYYSAITDHERRVRWQLHRIYRTRNQLVHSGSVPVYLEPLVVNSLEYFRATIGPIIGRASRESSASDIDQMVAEIGIDYQISKRRVSNYKKANFDVADYVYFFR